MNTAMRLIIISALVAGGVGLYAVGGDGDVTSPPAAEPAALDPAEVLAAVTGTEGAGRQVDSPELTTRGFVYEHRGERYESDLVLSDLRLSGEMWSVHDYDRFIGAPMAAVISGRMGIDNENGSWAGTFRGFQEPGTGLVHYNALVSGSDAYDGLTAMLAWTDQGNQWDINGIVFPGEMPDYPEMD